MDYWTKNVEGKYSMDIIETHTKLQKWREMYSGAIWAASLTKTTGEKHYVGLPADEPADIVIRKYIPVKTRLGTPATNALNLRVQITRCNLGAGETLRKQISNKNKPAYKNLVLLVHLIGPGISFDFNDVRKYLKELDQVYPSEIIVLARLESNSRGNVPPGTFMEYMIYPDEGYANVNLQDNGAFFRFPPIIGRGYLGASRKIKELGKFNLLPPKI